MKISPEEQRAIRDVLAHGRRFGYGNLISHLQTAWASSLMEAYGMEEETARLSAGGPGYPFLMQQDVLERGEWDETGKRYERPSIGADVPGGGAI